MGGKEAWCLNWSILNVGPTEEPQNMEGGEAPQDDWATLPSPWSDSTAGAKRGSHKVSRGV